MSEGIKISSSHPANSSEQSCWSGWSSPDLIVAALRLSLAHKSDQGARYDLVHMRFAHMSDPNAHWPMHIVWPVVVKMNLIVAGPRPLLAHKSNQIWSGAWDLHTWVISCWNGVCEVQDKLQLYTCIFIHMWPRIMVVPALNSKTITCTLKISRGVGHDLMHGCCAHEWPDDEKLNLL